MPSTLRSPVPELCATRGSPRRRRLSRDEWLRFLEAETDRLDYPNFKSRVQRLSGSHRHDVYLRVWSVMRGLRDPGAERDVPTR